MPLQDPRPDTLSPPSGSPWPAASKILTDLYAHKGLFALAGTLAMVVFFWRIHYLPSLALTDIALVAAAIVFFSVVMVIVVVLTLMLPAAVLIEWQKSGFITDRSSVRTSETHWLPPAGLSMSMAMLGAGLATGWMYVWFFTPLGDAAPILFAGVMLVGAAGAFAPMGMKLKPIDEPVNSVVRKRKIWWALRLTVLSACLYLFTLPLIALVVFGTHSAAATMNGWEVLLVSLGLPLLHLIILSIRTLPLWIRMVALALVITPILLIAGTPFESLDRAASTFQLGMLRDQSVVVSSEGCRMVRASGVSGNCRRIDGPGKELYEIRDVFVLNRLGSHTVIAEPGWTPKTRTRSIPLPSSEVFTWYKTPETPRAPPPSLPPEPRAPASVTPPPPMKATPRAVRKSRPRQRAPAC